MFQRLGCLLKLFGQALTAAASKRRGQVYARPSLEFLESRTLLSFTASPAINMYSQIQNSGPTTYYQINSTSNPGNVAASWQTSGQSVSTQGSGSCQITDSSLIVDESIQSTEHFTALSNDFIPNLDAETHIDIRYLFSGSLAARVVAGVGYPRSARSG
jgi:hypothetical protein